MLSPRQTSAAVFIAIGFGGSINAQVAGPECVHDVGVDYSAQWDSTFVLVDSMPSFLGGQVDMHKYLKDSIRYPEEAVKAGIQGTVFIAFVVEKDGRTTNAQVLRGIGGGCDEVAVRAVKQMPTWTPGEHKGQTVRVRYTLPVKFTLPVSPSPTESYSPVEEMPLFPGGEEALVAFIQSNLHYPNQLLMEKIAGTVLARFSITEEGIPQDPKVIRGVHPLLDEEALRLIRIMPPWTPGKQYGKPVRVLYTLPIRFEQD